MREFWKSFCIALKTSKKSIGISIILSCAILCFFWFQIVQKSQNRDLLLTNDEQKVKEQYELFVEKYETASNQDEFINMNTSILRNYYMLELSKKYGIQYTIDERVDDLNRLASQYIEINWEEAESPVLMESTYELEQKMSLSYSDYIEEKLMEIDTSIEQLQNDFPTPEIQNEVEKLLEQKKVYETLKTENDYANLKTVPVEKALSLLEEIYELPKTEEELVENDIIPLYYQNYQEYLENFSSSKKLIEREYKTILNALLEDQTLSSKELKTSQLYTIKDAWQANYTYMIVIILMVLLLAIPLVIQDYDTHFVTQYYIHMEQNHYLIGKLGFLFLWLLILSLFGVLAITIFAIIYCNNYSITEIGVIENNMLVHMNIFGFLLPCLLQLLIGFSLLEFIHCFAIRGTKSSILYLIVIFVSAFLLYIPFLMDLPNLQLFKVLPFSYLNYSQSVERNLLSLSQIWMHIGIMIAIIMLLYGIQRLLCLKRYYKD